MATERTRTGDSVDGSIVSAVLPVYNEERVLAELCVRVAEAIRLSGCRPELVCVNDGSTDSSGAILDALAADNPHLRVLHLSRNFGHQAAVQAGIAHATGDAVVVMDSDLQDDPAGIARFIEKWRGGFDVVYAIRTSRKENIIKRVLFHGFYRVLNRVSATPMPNDAGNFGLVDRQVAASIAELPDRDRYFAGLRSWVGFRQLGVPVERGPRYDGRPRVSMRGLFRLAKSAIISFSSLPLTVFYGISLSAWLVFIGVGSFCLYHKLFTGLAIPGWTSTLLTASFFGAINALGIAILGEYVTRIYDQVRGRPMYLVQRKVNFAGEAAADREQSQRRAA